MPDLGDSHVATGMSEAEATSSIMRGHGSMMAVLSARHKNQEIIRALWTGGNVKVRIQTFLFVDVYCCELMSRKASCNVI